MWAHQAPIYHENTDVSLHEKAYLDNQIQSLIPTKIFSQTGVYNIFHIMIFSMIDGKVCNAITDTHSTQKCYLCRLTSKSFNNMDLVVLQTNVDETAIKFGLSTLHAWIRFFENLLHLSYKLPLKK